MNGRRVIIAAGLAVSLAAAGLYFERRRRWRAAAAAREAHPPRPPGVPLSRFSADATAAEVTNGIDLSGRLALVTGATSGIGLETMRVLALRGAEVIGTGRTMERAAAACASVNGRTVPLAMDLTRYSEVVAVADAVSAMARPLDILVCNAGIMALPRLEQVEGVEKQFATNHLGHFLLATRLLSLLTAAPQGRVVVVSSQVLSWADPGGIEWDNLSGERDYDPRRAYGQSKLANALFALELSRRLSTTRATANWLHPGFVDTQLFRHFPLSLNGMRGLLTRRRKVDVPRGAATSCYLASAPALARVSGHYFRLCNPEVPDARAKDRSAAERLWTTSERLLANYLTA